ncbi:hypothetical protein KAI65_05575 [Candidatus Parcubacteria bacterium]|nr:hypothetical protein [Candidatus Parcubacteria bacterium]
MPRRWRRNDFSKQHQTVGTGHCPVQRVKNEKIINIITKNYTTAGKNDAVITKKQGSFTDRTGQCPVPTNNPISSNPQ